ncbi:hypothetical protein ACYULU_04345 [Breznakiellaceae bacterium SP9]
MKMSLAVVLVLVIPFTGWASQPEWFVNPPDAEDIIFGLGSGKLRNDNLARQLAIIRAQTSIVYTIRANVVDMLTDYAKEAGILNDSFAESISRQMPDVDVSGGVMVFKTEKGPDGIWYAAVILSKEDAAAAAASIEAVQEAIQEADPYGRKFKINALDRMQQQLEKNNVKPEPVTE